MNYVSAMLLNITMEPLKRIDIRNDQKKTPHATHKKKSLNKTHRISSVGLKRKCTDMGIYVNAAKMTSRLHPHG